METIIKHIRNKRKNDGKNTLTEWESRYRKTKKKNISVTLNKKYDSLKHETPEIVKKGKNKSIYIKEESV